MTKRDGQSRRAVRRGIVVLRPSHAVILVFAVLLGSAGGAEKFFEQEPFDQITLNKQNGDAVLKVEPLDLPDRLLPQRPRPTDKLVVRLWDQPESDYEIQWRSIAKVELFEDLVLAKTRELFMAGQFEEAYDYFQFLRENHPKLPGLEAALDDYLYEQAKAMQRSGKYDGAWAMLQELCRRNPKYVDLDRALGVAAEKLVDGDVAASHYAVARARLRSLAARFPNHPVVAKREAQLAEEAARLLGEARKALAAGDFREADRTGRRVMEVWPAAAGARETLDAVRAAYPRVIVGVTTLAGATDRPADWASRRAGRLLRRTLVEFAAPGADGGQYTCSLAQLDIEDTGRRLVFAVRPNVGGTNGATWTGGDLARRLLAEADAKRANARPAWSELLAGVAVRDIYRVEVELRRPQVRPDALLQDVVVSPGPYTIERRDGQEVCYVANGGYFAAEPKQPREMVERCYPGGTGAVSALSRGEIQVLDRVNPWDLGRLRAAKGVKVEPYAVPLIHCLVPNPRKPLTASRTFRRALVYGIHREAILKQLLGGEEVPGCRVASGPFPAAQSRDDPLGYACDESISPRPYDPRLAMALAEVALQEAAAASKSPGKTAAKTLPRLVLAHPPHEIARLACAAIKRQLELVGIPIALRELDPQTPPGVPADVDLLYAEMAVCEPVTDASRLLGEAGLAGGCSPFMSMTLRQLDQATTWPEARNKLWQVHRIVHEEASLVPLWQLVDHLAFREEIQGVGSHPATLYQNIEKWRIAFPNSEGEK
ncbi:MAG: ABC transporter substrate-binding protein [Pirellulales bacterium]